MILPGGRGPFAPNDLIGVRPKNPALLRRVGVVIVMTKPSGIDHGLMRVP